MDDLHQGGNDHPFGDNHHQIVKGWNGTEGIYFFKSARYSMVCFFWSKLEHISIFMSMIGSSDPIWNVAQQSDEGCSFGNTNYLLHRVEMKDNDFISLECEMFDNWLLREWVGKYVNLHVDDWVFGFNVTHGPTNWWWAFLREWESFFLGLKWKTMIHFFKVRDIQWLTSSEVSWKICHTSYWWLGLRIQFDVWPRNLADMRSFGNTNQHYCTWVEMRLSG